jgi:putative spermidine/putrescine transport system substrate-binding protein
MPALRGRNVGMGEVLKGHVIPVFEREFKCKVDTDSAAPFHPKLQATPKYAPKLDK